MDSTGAPDLRAAREAAQAALKTPISEQTAAQYAQAWAKLKEAKQGPLEYVTERGLSKSAYYLMKAAAQHKRAEAIIDHIKKADRARKKGDTEKQAHHEAWAVKLGGFLMRTAPDYDRKARAKGEAGAYTKANPDHPRRHSKRATMPRRADWREAVIAALPPAHRLAATVQAATGCRPAELVRGVTLGTDANGNITAHIIGAKVTERSGQPWRVVTIDRHTAPAALIAAAEAGERVKIPNQNSYQVAVTRAGLKCKFKGLSPYSFRHQFASDCKRAGMAPEQIAAAMGHISTKMLERYGQHSSGKGRGPVSARAARVARNTRSILPQPEPTPAIAAAVPSIRPR